MRNRLGFAVKVLARPGLKSHDARRWQTGPHLRVSLGYLDAIFDYLDQMDIRMYRISSDIAPYVTHPDLPRFHRQIEECENQLTALGEKARSMDLRLSMHPSQFIVLNSPDERVATASIADFDYHARFLDALGVGPEGKIVTHVGGVYGDRAGAMRRWVERYERLSPEIRARLVLENDEISYGVLDIGSIHDACGVPLVFDILHHRVNNPAGISEVEACRMCLGSWPAGQMPKIHFSTQRTEARTQGKRAAGMPPKPAKPGEHDDWIDPVDFVEFRRRMSPHRFDVMLEAKQKDLALLGLRNTLLQVGLSGDLW